MFLKNLFKKKKLEFTAYTYFEYVNRLYPIEMAKRRIPNSFSSLPNFHSGADKVTCPYTKLTKIWKNFKTIKHCDGILDLWSTAMILPAPFDLAINIKDNKVTLETTQQPDLSVVVHPEVIYGDMFPNYVNMKFISPYRMFSNKHVNCLLVPAFYHLEDNLREDLIIPMGVVNFALGQELNINFFVKKQFLQKVIHIKAGTPMYYIIPMTDEDFDVKSELITREEWESRNSFAASFKSLYKKYKQGEKRKAKNLDN